MSNIEIIEDKYVYFGSFPQNGSEKEPIRWRILKREEGVLTLIADKIMMSFMYDRYYSEYSGSAVRKYIHTEFIPVAFTLEEFDMILPTDLGGYSDRVYIPSVDELKDLPREERIRKVTPVAQANGASAYPIYSKKDIAIKDNGWYWTRTPWKPPYNPTCDREVMYVEYNGSFTGRVTSGHDIGILPVIRLAID